jgi:hypothetical protein
MGAGFFAAPASAAIEITHSGEAELLATFQDTCAAQADALTADFVERDVDITAGDADGATGTRGAIATFLGATYAEDEDNVDNAQFQAFLANLTGGVGTSAPTDDDLNLNVTFVDNSCVGNAESPLWSTTSKLDWSAAGTLANGLSVSVDQDAAIGLSGAFGSVTFKNGGDSAAKASFAAGDGDLTVAGSGFGGHALNTAGTAGTVVTYQAPSVGGMDLYVSYAPNSARDDTADTPLDTDNSDYTDTIGIGAKFSVGDITLSGGWEAASFNASSTQSSSNACDYSSTVVIADAAAGSNDSIAASALIDDVYGTEECGDQNLMVVGAAINVGGLGLDAGWSKLDTGEADRTTTTFNLATSTGDYDLSVGYTNAVRSSKLAGADTTQTALAGTVSTALGDGVKLGLTVSNNKYDDYSQATVRGGAGATSDFLAEGVITISY